MSYYTKIYLQKVPNRQTDSIKPTGTFCFIMKCTQHNLYKT